MDFLMERISFFYHALTPEVIDSSKKCSFDVEAGFTPAQTMLNI